MALITLCVTGNHYVATCVYSKTNSNNGVKVCRYNRDDRCNCQDDAKYGFHSILHRTSTRYQCAQDLFTDKAVDVICSAATGIPRMVNRICDKSLIYAFQKQKRLVDDRMVEYVLENEMLTAK